MVATQYQSDALSALVLEVLASVDFVEVFSASELVVEEVELLLDPLEPLEPVLFP